MINLVVVMIFARQKKVYSTTGLVLDGEMSLVGSGVGSYSYTPTRVFRKPPSFYSAHGLSC